MSVLRIQSRTCLLGVLALSLLLCGQVDRAVAQDVTECDGVAWSADYQPANQMLPPSAASGLRAPVRFPLTQLEPIDRDALIAEDEAGYEWGKPQRVGVPRSVDTPVQGVWQTLPDGSELWNASVSVQGAEALRLHVTPTAAAAAADAEIFVHDNLVNGEVRGPYSAQDTPFWTASVTGDTVYVECVVSARTSDSPPVTIDQAGVIYNLVTTDDGLRAPLDCMGDVACYSDWEDVSYSVARITYQSWDDAGCQGCFYNCSGTLLASETADETPYFLTSAHCVDEAAEASTTEFLWFYQHDVCDGGFMTQATSLGASVLDTSGSSTEGDWTLLMVNGALPAGVFWSGWTTQDPAVGAWSVAVHHPSGSWKRYSRGQRFAGSFYYHQIRFNVTGAIGHIYYGSSGSGIFRESDQKLFGNASFGTGEAGCDNLNVAAYYGRFSNYYAGIQALLANGTDDGGEDNDICADAIALGDNTFTNLVVKRLDEDWYRFSVDYDENLFLHADFTNSYGNIDMELYDACGGNLLASSTTLADGETISYQHQDFPADVWLRVYLANDTRAFYDLQVLRTKEDCNGNGVVDSCDLDCGDPGSPCQFEATCGASFDCNSNAIPDECETDCNADGLADECALVAGPQDLIEICAGATAVFTVTASDPGYGIKWYGPGGELSDGGRVSGATTDTLTITDVESGDAGQYYAEILDGCLLATSDPATLALAQLATITTQPGQNIAKCLGQSAFFSIGVTGGTSTPNYQWYANEAPLANGGRYTGVNTASLQVDNLTFADMDVDFVCGISNACESALSQPGTVQINTPRILVQPRDDCGEVGGSVTLQAQLTSPATMYVQWRKEGGSAVGAGSSLTISDLELADAGEYYAYAFTLSPTCTAESDHATVTVATSTTCWASSPGDVDNDGDYDLVDMEWFTRCYGSDTTGDFCCSCANIDNSNDVVDMDDWAALEALISGPQ